MRDLFQVVFELKKKEIEMAKQHIEQNVVKFHTSGIFVEPAPDTKVFNFLFQTSVTLLTNLLINNSLLGCC